MRACVHVCVRACVRACVRERGRGLLMDAAFMGALVMPLFLLVPFIVPLVLVGVASKYCSVWLCDCCVMVSVVYLEGFFLGLCTCLGL